MRAATLLLEAPREQLEVLELPRLDHLRGEVGSLVGDELAGDVDPVRGEEATREPAVDRPVEVEGVPGDELADTGLRARSGTGGAAATRPRSARRPRACRSRPASPSGLPRSWSSAQRRTASGASASAACWTTAKRCSSSVPGWRAEPSVVADRPCANSGMTSTSAPVSRAEPERQSRPRPEQELRQLPHAVGVEPPADPLGRDVPEPAGLCAHLRQRVLREREAELRDEPQTAQDPQRVLPEAVRAHGVQLAPLEVREPAEGVDELAGREAPGHGVDREVAPRHVVRDRDGRIGDDLEVAMARPDAALLRAAA